MQPKKKKKIRNFTSYESSTSTRFSSSFPESIKHSKPKPSCYNHNICHCYNTRHCCNMSGPGNRSFIVIGIVLLSALVIYISLIIGSAIGDSKCGMGSEFRPSEKELPCGKIKISNSNLTSSDEPMIVSTNSTNSTESIEPVLERVGRCNLYYGHNYSDMYALCLNNDETQIYDYECDIQETLNTSCIEWDAKGLMYIATFLLGLCILILLLAAWVFIIASPIVFCWQLLKKVYYNDYHYKYKKWFLICATVLVYIFKDVFIPQPIVLIQTNIVI